MENPPMTLNERIEKGDKIRNKVKKEIKKVQDTSNTANLQSLDAIFRMNQNLKGNKLPTKAFMQTLVGFLQNSNLETGNQELTTTKLERQLRALQNLNQVQKKSMIADGDVDILESYTNAESSEEPDITAEDYNRLKVGYDQVLELGRRLNNARNDDFNELIDKNNHLNQEIFNKDKLIAINENSSNKQERIIMGIKPILILMILMILPLYLMLSGNISRNFGLLVIIASTIITLVVVTIRQIRSYDNVEKSVTRKNISTAKDFGRSLVQTLMPETIVKKCPESCSDDPTRTDKRVTIEVNEQSNEVWLDNPINVWKDGQVPTVAGNKTMMNLAEEEGYEYTPRPAYSAPKFAKTYTCVYNGNVDKMTSIEKIRGKEFKSEYPCQYWPGYIEKPEITISGEMS
jgi:hypothetical protein